MGILLGLALLLWMPLVVSTSTLHPFVVGKALYARAIIEVVVALWVVLLMYDRSYVPRRSWVLAIFGGYVVVALLSALQGVDVVHSVWGDYFRMLGVWNLFHWFLLTLVASSVLRTPRAWRIGFNLNLGVAVVLSLLALSQAYDVSWLYRLPLLPELATKCRVDASLGNPAYLGAILMVNIVLAAGLLASSFVAAGDAAPQPRRRGRGQERPRWWVSGLQWQRVFWVISAGLAMWALFYTGTRGALLGLAAGAVAMPIGAAIWGNRRAILPVSFAAEGILIALAFLFLFGQVVGFPAAEECRNDAASTRLTSTTLDEGNVATRITAAEIGWGAFLDRPLLGWGPENFQKAFEKLATPAFYQGGVGSFDNAHNKVVDEMATKGTVGTLFYVALWVALVWAVARRRRPPDEEVMAYAVLGALGAYFVNNIFLFDVNGALLQWALLVAWVIAQEQTPEEEAQVSVRGLSFMRSIRLPSGPLAKAGLSVAVAAVLGTSLYVLNYRPLEASRDFVGAFTEGRPLPERLDLAQSSFDTFTPLAGYPRRIWFEQIGSMWKSFSPGEKDLVGPFVIMEVPRALEDSPNDPLLLKSAIRLLQAVAPTPQRAESLTPLVDRLLELAPQRVSTFQVLANQELIKADYFGALRIIEEYEAEAPWTRRYFVGFKEAAQDGLRE
jgi:O-antigen ligase